MGAPWVVGASPNTNGMRGTLEGGCSGVADTT